MQRDAATARFTQRSHWCNDRAIGPLRACRSHSRRRSRPSTSTYGEPSVAYQAEYIWIDGVKPTPLLRNKTKILDDGVKDDADLGLRRLVDRAGHRRAQRLRAAARLHVSRPDPRRQEHPRPVRGAQRLGHAPAHHEHPCADPDRSRAPRRRGDDLRHRAGVHDDEAGRHAARLPRRRRVPRAAGPVLLRRRHRPHRRP